MSFHRKVKIIATLGPASDNAETLAKMIDAGANVFRINMSHNTPQTLPKIHQLVRAAEKSCGHPIGILADLQGPKLRLGTFADGEVELRTGQSFRVDLDETPGDATRACLPHPEIFSALEDDTLAMPMIINITPIIASPPLLCVPLRTSFPLRPPMIMMIPMMMLIM